MQPRLDWLRVSIPCEMKDRLFGEITAVVKNVVGKHYFLAVFGPIDAHFSSQPLRQPYGMAVSHTVKLNHTVIKKELGLG